MAGSSLIRSVDGFDVHAPVARPTGPSCATYTSRSAVVVRLESRDGVVGWGETYARAATLAGVSAAGEAVLARDPAHRRAVTADAWRASGDAGAASAVAIALDDLYARQLGVRVVDLYGGPVRDEVVAYASSGGYRDDQPPEESWVQEWDEAMSDGFRAAKFRIGRYDVARESRILERLRDVAGDEAVLMVDANGAYDAPTAIRVGARLAALGFTWFEEPLTRRAGGVSYAGYAALRGRVGLPVAAAEGLTGRSEFEEFMAAGKADIVQPDVAICGGIAETLFVAELAQLRGLQCVPHAWGGAILLAATLQTAALLPEASEVPLHALPRLEVDRFENPLRTELVAEELLPAAGRVALPDGPGLGIDVDEDVLKTYADLAAHHSEPATRHPALTGTDSTRGDER